MDELLSQNGSSMTETDQSVVSTKIFLSYSSITFSQLALDFGAVLIVSHCSQAILELNVLLKWKGNVKDISWSRQISLSHKQKM